MSSQNRAKNREPSGTHVVPKTDNQALNIYLAEVYDTLHGWSDALVSLAGLGTVGAGVPAEEDILGTTWRGRAMSDEHAAASEKILHAQTQISHFVRRGTEIRFHIHYVLETAVVAGQNQVQWELSYGTLNRMGNLATERLGTATVIQTLPVGARAGYYGIKGLVIIVDDDIWESSLFHVRMRRKSSDTTNDTYLGKVYILSADGHTYMEKLGTIEEIPR